MPSAAPPPSPRALDLVAARDGLRRGDWTAEALLERCFTIAQSAAVAPAFLSTDLDAALQAARVASPDQPLAGLAVSVKDLFDVQGQVSAAASQILANQPPAAADCPAVARLRAAGGALLGRTHMVEFAFSGVGTHPRLPTPANGADPLTPRIPGGSSSGAAVSVASGAVFVGLGTDTGGSIRIPAALNGIVGFKSTARRVPTQGVVPLAPSLDTVCAMTRSVRDAVLVHGVLSDRPVVLQATPLSQRRLAVPRAVMLDGLDTTVATAFWRSVDRLRQAGAAVDEIDLPEIAELGPMQAKGALVTAEACAWHRPWTDTRPADYDPRVLSRLLRGAALNEAELRALRAARQHWIVRMAERLAPFDALLSPTVPLVAPPMAPLLADDDLYYATNALLLRNTSVVNMLDGCALSLPCHQGGELPVGLMLWQGAMQDERLLSLGLQVEAALAAA